MTHTHFIALATLLILGICKATAEPSADRLTLDVMERLVSAPMQAIRAGHIEEANKRLDAMVRNQSLPLQKADLLESFAALSYIEAQRLSNPALTRLSIDCFRRAADAYRVALGAEHPDVATSLQSYATLLSEQKPGVVPAAAIQAFNEAHDIRVKAFGPKAGLTLATLLPMADAISAAENLDQNSGGYQHAKAIFQTVLTDSADVADRTGVQVRLDAFAKLVTLDLRAKAYESAFQAFVRLDEDGLQFRHAGDWKIKRSQVGYHLYSALHEAGQTRLASDLEQRLSRTLPPREQANQMTK